MAEDDQLLPVSALHHMIFCPRQAALIHVERIWPDNARTVQGSDLHAIPYTIPGRFPYCSSPGLIRG